MEDLIQQWYRFLEASTNGFRMDESNVGYWTALYRALGSLCGDDLDRVNQFRFGIVYFLNLVYWVLGGAWELIEFCPVVLS